MIQFQSQRNCIAIFPTFKKDDMLVCRQMSPPSRCHLSGTSLLGFVFAPPCRLIALFPLSFHVANFLLDLLDCLLVARVFTSIVAEGNVC